tara:strand:+ start:4350 stop:5285 length:936 start_codon:yes stop_codon:yes gene_type:complete
MNNYVCEFSIVIPVYGSARILKKLYERINEVFYDITNNYELIFIEDSSPDNAWDVIFDISSFDSRVRAFKLSKNFGQHNALLCGIREARGEFIITLDDDLQNPPEEIPNLIKEIKKGFDIVYGKPKKEKRIFYRKIITQITKFSLDYATGNSNSRNISSFRIFRSMLRHSFQNFNNETVNIDILLTYSSTNLSFINVEHDLRYHDKSGYNLLKLVKHTINIVTGLSTAPLHFATLLGIFLSIFGLFIFTFVILQWFLFGSVVRGFTFIASLVALFSGSQLLALGVLGLYISKIHNNLLHRPSYVVKEKINN